MSTDHLPIDHPTVRLNLEFYRKAAKSLLKAAHAGDARALERIARHSPKPGGRPALHHAQLAIAREQGFASWPRFKTFLEESLLDFHGLVEAFVTAAVSDVRRAEDTVRRHPEIAGAGLFTALVLGDVQRVERALDANPQITNVKGGPCVWEPLLYACFSRFANGRSSRARDLTATAQLLLSHGADPNAFHVDERWPDSPRSCLYGATGINNNPALARALLDAGASPDDSEAFYHSTEHADLACLRLLLEFGATPRHGLNHMLDYENIDGLRLLLAAGADPDKVNQRGETALHWAVWRGRSAPIVAALLDAGVDMDARRKDGRTAYALAVQSGQTETAALLELRGANTDLSALDRFLGACSVADPSDLSRIVANSPEVPLPPECDRMLPEFAASHRAVAVRALLAAGVAVNTPGDYGGTALHWACWKGYADLVEMLIDHGASLTVEDEVFHATPAGWFLHGLRNSLERDGDYPQVARLLITSGASIAADNASTGDAGVDAVLREHGAIT
jgi:ankyrin repeat protein